MIGSRQFFEFPEGKNERRRLPCPENSRLLFISQTSDCRCDWCQEGDVSLPWGGDNGAKEPFKVLSKSDEDRQDQRGSL